MNRVLAALQVVMVLAWAVPLLLFVGSAFAKARTSGDSLRAAVWAVAFVNVLFPLRWLLFGGMPEALPTEQMAAWAALYVFSSVSAFGVTYTARNVRS